ncbi:MAG: ABC transporter ATP-binding protein [Candidatus Algichlamydia australiensis]|nr:ABC transporter ATP-binding protein [Chlamydiales bacterium]
MSLLQARDLKKIYKGPSGKLEVLSRLSLSLERGETIAIMGPSGVGKSTLLSILGTLEKPTSGYLEILGKNALKGDLSKKRNHLIGFIFQRFHLLEEFTALQNVLLPGRIAGEPDEKRALMLLEKVGLEERANFLAKVLSGGEKQRVAIARALMNDPQIILADEPTGNLDSHTSSQVQDLLLTLCREMQKSLIVATHDEQLALKCDRTIRLAPKSPSLNF